MKPWEQSAETDEPDRPSLAQRVSRGTALAGRALVEGVADLAVPFANPIAYVGNKALEAAGAPEQYRFPEQGQAVSQALTDIGVPEPVGSESAVNLFGRMGTGMGLSALATPQIMARLGLLPKQPAPSAESLRQGANAAYQAVDDAGVVMAKPRIQSLVNDISNATRKLGIDQTLHPRATAALGRLQSTLDDATDMPFSELEILRRVARNAASSADASERKIAYEIINKLDDFVATMGDDAVVAGDPRAASAAISSARDLYSRAAKSSEMTELVTRARNAAPNFSASGLENALRTQFRQLANNPRRLRLFSALEQQAIQRVARGGPLENALRMLGKFAPRGVVSTALSGGAGFAVGGAPGAAAVMGVGEGGRLGATAMTLRNVRRAEEIMRRGGPIPPDIQKRLVGSGVSPSVINFMFGEIEGEPEQESEPTKPWER